MRSIIPILAPGGRDQPLWPLARAGKAKAFHALYGSRTLIQDAALGVKALAGHGVAVGPLAVIAAVEDAELVLDQLATVDVSPGMLVLTPGACSAAAAAALACFVADELDPGALALVSPCDQPIEDEAGFASALRRHAGQAEANIVAFGEASLAEPRLEVTLFRPGVMLEAFTGEARAVRDAVSAAWFGAKRGRGRVHLDAPSFVRAPNADLASVFAPGHARLVMAQDSPGRGALVSWAQVLEAAGKDSNGVAQRGRAQIKDCRDSLVIAEGPPVAVCGVDGLIVVATPEGVLVVAKERADEVEALVASLRGVGAP